MHALDSARLKTRGHFQYITPDQIRDLFVLGVLCDRRRPVKLNGKGLQKLWSVRPALLYGADTWATTRGQEARLEVNDMKMSKIQNAHYRKTLGPSQHVE